MAARRTVRIDKNDQVIVVGQRGFQEAKVHGVVVPVGKGESVQGAADDLFQHMSILGISWIQDERVRGGSQPIPKGAENQIGGAGAGKNIFRRDAASLGDGV